MEIIRTILTVIYFIVALAVIILATIQSKDDAGLSSTITGSSTNNFYEKNKGRTKEGKQKRRSNSLCYAHLYTYELFALLLDLYVSIFNSKKDDGGAKRDNGKVGTAKRLLAFS